MSNFGKWKIGLFAALTLAILSPAANAQTTLRLAVETTPGDPLNVMLTTFRDELQKSAGSDVTIEFFEGGALGDETALMEMIRVNQAQVVPLGSEAVVRVRMLRADATRIEDWQWRSEDVAGYTYDSNELAAHCVDSLAYALQDRAR